MKMAPAILIGILLSSCAFGPVKPEPPVKGAQSAIEDTSQFLFFAVLEGLYEDGVSNEDVDRILLRTEGGTHVHFVPGCPICGPSIWALEAYRSRPESLSGLKKRRSTFGSGLPPNIRAGLWSANPRRRMEAVETLMDRWVSRRFARTSLTPRQRDALCEEIMARRDQGMSVLKKMKDGTDLQTLAGFGPFSTNACAACDGATGRAGP